MKHLIALLAVFLLALPAMADTTNASSQQIEVNAQVSFGLSYAGNTNLLNFIEPGTTTARYNASTTIFVPPSTTDQVVNLATLFPYVNTPLVWGWKDISSPGQSVSWGLEAAGSKFTQAAGGFTLQRVNGSAPTIYITNASTTTAAILQVFLLAN